MRGTAAQIQEKWANRLSGATAEISAGIDRVTVAPGQKAAAKKDKWLQNVQASQDKWASRVAGVSLEAWKNAAKTIGVARVATGAQAKKDKFGAFIQEFGAHLDMLDQKLANMPDTTFEQRLQRMTAAARHNHDFKRSGR
jgi:uncharacterized protein YeaO (DUF488 family)